MNFKQRLLEGEHVSLTEELLLNAQDFLHQGNYRLAVIEAESAFESAVYEFLLQYYKNSPDIIKKISEDIHSFVNLIKKPFTEKALNLKAKQFTKENRKAGKNYLEWEKHVWEIRGDLVHGRISTVSYQEASKAIQVVEDLLFLFFNRPKTKVNQYSRLTIKEA